MNNVLCIYPKDNTTAFLQPICDALSDKLNAHVLYGDPIDDDDYLDKLEYEVLDADTVVFLGHGSSKILYGIGQNQLICSENENVYLLEGKKLILFACRSCEFIHNHNLKDAWGFGFIPTSLDDARDGRLHNVNTNVLEGVDIDYFKDAIVRIWVKSLNEADVNDILAFYKAFNFNTNVEIVKCLLKHKELPHRRIISDMLYYLKEEMTHIQ